MLIPYDQLHPGCKLCLKQNVAKHDIIDPETKRVLYKKGSFPIKCDGIPADPESNLVQITDPSIVRAMGGEGAIREMARIQDPILWAQDNITIVNQETGDRGPWLPQGATRDNIERYHLDSTSAYYQELMVRCTARRSVYRIGRRCIPLTEPVVMSDGSIKAIGDIEVGDLVLSYNFITKKIEIKQVLEVFENGKQKIFQVNVEGRRRVTCTSNHPIYTVERGWLTIDDGLEVGFHVLTLTGNKKDVEQTLITSIKEDGEEDTRDISIEDNYNFFVDKILVHNSGKSHTLAAKALHKMCTNEGYRVILIAPGLSHIDNIFDIMNEYIEGSPTLKSSKRRFVRTPYRTLELQNGSRIRGFVSGGETVRGQCLPEGTRIWMADGTFKLIENINLGDKVLCIDAKNKKAISEVSYIFQPEVKETLKVTLGTGRVFRASPDHAFLGNNQTRLQRSRYNKKGNETKTDWQKLSEWKVGDHLAIAVGVLNNVSESEFTDTEVELIGLMAGDGCCTSKKISNGSIGFTSGNNEIVKRFSYLLDTYNLDYRITKSRNHKEFCIRAPRTRNKHFSDLLDKGGILNCASYQKVFSDTLMRTPYDQKLILLKSLIATDGWISKTVGKHGADQIEIGFTSTSEKLAEQFGRLLAELGIVYSFHKRKKYLNGERKRDQYSVKVRSFHDVQTVLKAFGPVVGKTQHDESICSGNHKNQYSLLKTGDIFLDEIKSIEDCGFEKCYDMSVRDTNNFIIENGIITHNSGDMILIDEAAYIGRTDLEAVLFILTEHKNTLLLASSTPTGAREQFYKWDMDETSKSFHYPSMCRPIWDVDMETEMRKENPGIKYRHEALAEHGEMGQGVFQHEFIDRALNTGDYEYKNSRYDPSWIYTIGVDWNPVHGTEIVVVGADSQLNPPKYTVVDTGQVFREGHTQMQAMREIIDLTRKWKPAAIYVDRGAGSVQVEFLEEIGSMKGQDEELKSLASIITPIDFGSKITISHPLTGEQRIDFAKPLVVENAVRMLEGDLIQLSRYDSILEQQLRGFIIAKIGSGGRPVYTTISEDVEDHRLDAFMLALFAFMKEFSRLGKPVFNSDVQIVETLRSLATDLNISEMPSPYQKHRPTSRTIDKQKGLDKMVESDREFGLLAPSEIKTGQYSPSYRPFSDQRQKNTSLSPGSNRSAIRRSNIR